MPPERSGPAATRPSPAVPELSQRLRIDESVSGFRLAKAAYAVILCAVRQGHRTMAERPSTAQPAKGQHIARVNAGAGLGFARRLSGAVIVAERVAPLILPLALVACLFVILSWFGYFRAVPDGVRIMTGVGLAVAGLGALWPLRRLALPGGFDVDHRLERDNRLAHRPITTQDDTLVRDDPFARALWKAHQANIARGLGRVDPVRARTTIPARDPWALRALAPLLLVTAFAYSFAPGGGTLADVARSHGAETAVPARIDAWITPPAYTAIAPVFLTSDLNAGKTAFTVPEGSTVTVRIAGGNGTEQVSFPTPDAVIAADGGADGRARAFEAKVEAGGALSITDGEHTLGGWSIAMIADEAPDIAFAAEAPLERAANGTITLNYTATDDYRVAAARGLIELADPDAAGGRPLYGPPELPLALPRRNAENGAARTVRDLTEHPWAGAEVRLTLQAEDDLGQTGRSATRTLVLPGRPFSDPLARALIEQRRNLALDAGRQAEIVDLFDALMLYPEETIDNAAHFLGLSTARTRLADARDDDQLRGVVDYLWEIARQIEDGGLTDAERRLRQAQQALRDALERGASDAEIARLMDDLRQAMQAFLQEFAERALNDPNLAQQMPQMDGQEIDRQTLDEMMDRIEQMARSGAREQAMDMLRQLENMMNNLQMARPDRQGQGENQAQRQMNELGEILREQQQLMDETFRQNRQGQQGQQGQQQRGQQGQQGQQQPGQQGQQGQQGQMGQNGPGGLQGLAPDQQALRQRLDEFLDGLRGMGIQPGDDFGEAGRAMGEAGDALGGNEGEQALAEQGNAMDALRRGAGDMMRQMQQQAMNGRAGSMEPGGTRNGDARDPLGRPQRSSGPDFGESVDVPDEIDVRRAREILEAIRDRLGDALSPRLEREYLERLLELR